MADKMLKTDKTIDDYVTYKDKTPVSESVKGFIIKNNLRGKTSEEIDVMVTAATLHGNGKIKGDGDNFKEWAERMGRPVPSDELVLLMNGDPHNARIIILQNVAENPMLYRAYCSYIAGRGRKRV